MRKHLILLAILISASAAPAQTPEQLLADTAHYYQTLDGYEFRGHALLQPAASHWQYTFDINIVRAKLAALAPDAAEKMHEEASSVFNFKDVDTRPELKEASKTQVNISPIYGHFARMAEHVVRVEKTGEESLPWNGTPLVCTILKVTYPPSTYEHSHPEVISYWIAPSTHLVLKQVYLYAPWRDTPDALWTITFNEGGFNLSPPQWLLDSANIPDLKLRTEWIGNPAPDFTLPAADGKPLSLSSLRGKVVLLDFWSITCGPCKLEMPMLESVEEQYRSRDVDLLGISFDPTDKSQKWLDQNHHALHTLTDANFTVSESYKVGGIPSLVLIGRDGHIRQYWEGTVDKQQLEAALDKEETKK